MILSRNYLPRTLRRRGSPSGPTPAVAPDERVYAIGDVHGQHGLLVRLLDRIVEDAEERRDERRLRLVFLGDYVDRGDASRDVLALLARLGETQALTARLDFLVGNHEAALLDFLDDPDRGRAWLAWGGAQTLASYGVQVTGPAPEAAPRETLHDWRDALALAMAEHLAFVEGLAPMTRSGDVVFTHAGLHREGEDLAPDIWGSDAGAFLAPRPLPGLRVVHGHFDDPDPVSHPGRVCVDTGAYYSGVLTAVRLDDGEAFLSVRATDV